MHISASVVHRQGRASIALANSDLAQRLERTPRRSLVHQKFAGRTTGEMVYTWEGSLHRLANKKIKPTYLDEILFLSPPTTPNFISQAHQTS
jgi:hypothetical protein